MRLTLAALALATGLAGIGAAQAAPASAAPKAGITAPTQVVKAKMIRKRHVVRHKMHRHGKKHVRFHRAPKATPKA